MPQYELLIEPDVYKERKRLPGHLRQRIKRVFDDFVDDPRPPGSQPLDVTGLDVPSEVEVRWLRMDQWRVIYGVSDDENWVWVLAVCRRPPYNYEDLDDLVARLE